MIDLGKVITGLGIAVTLIGLLITFGSRIPFIGRLPGDIFIQKDTFTFYFPLATSILISLILTLLFNLFRK